MVSEPKKWVQDMADAGASQFTFHLEATSDPMELIRLVRASKMKVGIAIRPGTSVDDVLPFAASVDLVLVMTVEPGFGGQSFMEDMMPKVKKLRELHPSLSIEVDGGISPANAEIVGAAGANWIVAGSSVFKAPDVKTAILHLRTGVDSNQ